MRTPTLFEKVKKIHEQIPGDCMGGSPLDKCFLMAYLARRLELKTFIEIGVYRGKSLFSVAPAFADNDGRCYGIDPWLSDNFKEVELSDDLRALVDHHADTTDFDALYQEVSDRSVALDMEDTVTLIRKTSEDAAPRFAKRFKKHGAFIDMLHIDGNHDEYYVNLDAKLYIPMVRKGGVIVFDDIDWEGVRKVYDREKETHIVLYESDTFGVLLQDEELAAEAKRMPHPPLAMSKYRHLQTLLPALIENVRFCEEHADSNRPYRVFAGVMTYNSSANIEDCLRSIMMQEGQFEIEIGVFDDASTDDTVAVVNAIQDIPKHVHISVHTKEVNEGYEKNYIRVIREFMKSGFDFLACIDGADYLLSPDRFQLHLDEMLWHPECAVTFNRLKLYYEDKAKFTLWDRQDALDQEVYTAFDLAKEYFIRNGSCTMVRHNATHLPEELFTKAKIGDWLTYCTYATRGDICYLDKPMNACREHHANAPEKAYNEQLLYAITEYNKLTDYLFYNEFFNHQANIFSAEAQSDENICDLLVIDDVYPHPMSGFRSEEFTAYLDHFPNMRILCHGRSTPLLGKKSFTEILTTFKQAHPELADRLIETEHPDLLPMDRALKAKLAYFCFLGNVYASVDTLEKNHIPFVFELYPGGGFSLNADQSDQMLMRVTKSPCFRKVIVTQDVTRDYLLNHGFCTKEQIIEIFGVVTPQRALNTIPQINEGGDDSTLKVCFAAMRYTPTGKDKGYDVFLDVARRLALLYDNIEFHVAGSFDESILPLGGLEKRFQFHGVLSNEALGEFLKEMDIIVSPTINDALSQGAFDGFPTATCTEAGLNGALIMSTDPLGLNGDRFAPGEEIEIITRDPDRVAEKIAYYYHHRDRLRQVIRQQHARIQALYGTETQIGTRIRVLEREIERWPETAAELELSRWNKMSHQEGILYYSASEAFSMEHALKFDTRIAEDGTLEADIPVGNLDLTQAYVWICLINGQASVCQNVTISYGDRALKPTGANGTEINGVYYCGETSLLFYLGQIEEITPNHKHLHLEGDLRLDTPAAVQQSLDEVLKQQIAAAVLHADCPEKMGQYAPVNLTYMLGEDGHFDFRVNLADCPTDHRHLWLYFAADHRCLCRFDTLELNGEPLTISDTNGKLLTSGRYAFPNGSPCLYFSNAPLGDSGNELHISGHIEMVSKETFTLTDELRNEYMEPVKPEPIQAALLHADAIEHHGLYPPLSIAYDVGDDGSFDFRIAMNDCPASHQHLWLYFAGNNRCLCRFDRIELNGNPLTIAEANGSLLTSGRYAFNTDNPCVYFTDVMLEDGSGELHVSGCIEMVTEETFALTDEICHEFVEPVDPVIEPEFIQATLHHADALDRSGQYKPIEIRYLTDSDGHFEFRVCLDGCPMDHQHLWLYFANQPCLCRFDALLLNGAEIPITETNGWDAGNRQYLFRVSTPCVYCGGAMIREGENTLYVSGRMQAVSDESLALIDQLLHC